MAICSIVGCTTRTDRDKISFHKFPKDPTLKKAWTLCIRRKDWSPGKTSVVCGKHFEAKCFKARKERAILDENAIPTLFPTHKVVCDIIEEPIEQEVSSAYEDLEKCYQDVESYMNESDSSEHSENFMNEYHNDIEAVAQFSEVPHTSEDLEESYQSNESNINRKETHVTYSDESDSAEDFMNEDLNAMESIDESHEQSFTETENTAESTQASSTVIYRVIDATVETREYFENQLKNIRDENNRYRKKIKILHQTTRRLNKKVAKMENFINSYRLNHVLSDSSLQILNSIPAIDNEILTLQLAEQSKQPENFESDYRVADHISDADVINCSSDDDSN